MAKRVELEAVVKLIDDFTGRFRALSATVGKQAKTMTGAMAGTAAAGRKVGHESAAAFAGAAAGAKKATKSAGDLSTGFKRLSHTIFSLRHVFATVIAGFIVRHLVRMGSEVESIGYSFENLQKSMGQIGSKTMAALRKATRGTVSDLELMKAANQAMLLGVAETEKQFEELAFAGRVLGKAMGRTAVQGFNDLGQGIGRQQRLILDNLGIIVSAEAAYRSYARALGVSVEQLTDAQKKEAFRAAALDSIREKVKSLGMDYLTQGERMQMASATMQNSLAELSRAMMPSFVNVAESLSDVFQDNKKELKDLGIALAEFIKTGIPAAIKGLGTLIGAVGKLAGEWVRARDEMAAYFAHEHAALMKKEGVKALAGLAEKTRERHRLEELTTEELLEQRNLILEQYRAVMEAARKHRAMLPESMRKAAPTVLSAVPEFPRFQLRVIQEELERRMAEPVRQAVEKIGEILGIELQRTPYADMILNAINPERIANAFASMSRSSDIAIEQMIDDAEDYANEAWPKIKEFMDKVEQAHKEAQKSHDAMVQEWFDGLDEIEKKWAKIIVGTEDTAKKYEALVKEMEELRYVAGHWEEIADGINKSRGALDGLSTLMAVSVIRMRDQIGTVSRQIVDVVFSTFEALRSSLEEFFFDWMMGELKTFKEYLKAFLKDVARAVARAMSNLIMIPLMGGLGGIFKLPVSAVGAGQQEGGVVRRPGIYPLAEKGQPEAVVPLSRGRAIPVEVSGQQRNVPPVTFEFHVHAMDARSVQEWMAREGHTLGRIMIGELKKDPFVRRAFQLV